MQMPRPYADELEPRRGVKRQENSVKFQFEVSRCFYLLPFIYSIDSLLLCNAGKMA